MADSRRSRRTRPAAPPPEVMVCRSGDGANLPAQFQGTLLDISTLGCAIGHVGGAAGRLEPGCSVTLHFGHGSLAIRAQVVRTWPSGVAVRFSSVLSDEEIASLYSIGEGRRLELELTIPEDVPLEEVRRIIVDLVRHADALNRAAGGKGLKLDENGGAEVLAPSSRPSGVPS